MKLTAKIPSLNDLFDACKTKPCSGKCQECSIYKAIEAVIHA